MDREAAPAPAPAPPATACAQARPQRESEWRHDNLLFSRQRGRRVGRNAGAWAVCSEGRGDEGAMSSLTPRAVSSHARTRDAGDGKVRLRLPPRVPRPVADSLKSYS